MARCPDHDDGVHQMGFNESCSCGYRLQIMPIMVSVEVVRNGTLLLDRNFNCDSLDVAILALKEAVAYLEGVKHGT